MWDSTEPKPQEYDNATGFLYVMSDHSAAIESALAAVLPGALVRKCIKHREVSQHNFAWSSFVWLSRMRYPLR